MPDRTADAAPLILTTLFDADAFRRLDALRQAHFPPALNHIPAHLTLFHHLPGEELDGIVATLAETGRATPPLTLRFTGPRPLGRGVALAVAAPELAALRAALAARWAGRLTAQDRQGFRPHVTIQNKVAPDAARALHDSLAAGFTPWEARAEGLCLWHYRGGPWELAGRFPFLGTQPAA